MWSSRSCEFPTLSVGEKSVQATIFVLNRIPSLAPVMLITGQTLVQTKHGSGFGKLVSLLRIGAVFVASASCLRAD